MKTHHHVLFQAMACALLGVSYTAYAEKEDTELAPITVVSTMPVTDENVLIDENELNQSTANNARDLFRHKAGVEFEKHSVGGLGDIRIRGMGGLGSSNGTGQNRVAVSVDGVLLPDVFNYGHFTRNTRATFDTSDLKQVEVIKGANPASSLRGGLSGSVNFMTKEPADYYDADEMFGGNFRSGYSGQDDSWFVGATAAGQFSDEFSAMLSYTYRQFHEVENFDGLAVVGEARSAKNPADGDSNNLLTKLVFSPSAKHEFKLKVERFQQDYDTQLLNSKMSAKGDFFDRGDNARHLVSLRHHFKTETAMFDSGHWQLYQQRNRQKRSTDLAYGMSLGNTDYDVKTLGAEAVFNKALSNHQFNYGVRYENTDISVAWQWDAPAWWPGGGKGPLTTQYQPDTTVKQVTAFVGDDMGFADGRLHILPGIELTHYQINPDASAKNYSAKAPADSQSETELSWRLGATYDLNEQHQVFASYRNGLRVPSFAELNSKAGHGSAIPNPNLKPETVAGFELGLRSQGSWGSQTLSAFHDSYQQMIAKRTVSREPYQTIKYNKNEDVVIYGVEYEGTLNLDPVGLPQGTKLKASLAYTKGKDKTDDQPYSDIDPFNGYLGLAYDAPSEEWGAEVGVNFAAAKQLSAISTKDQERLQPIGGYGVVDLSAYYAFNKSLFINAGVYNVFDKKYATWSESQYAESYEHITEPGRKFAINMRYEF